MNWLPESIIETINEKIGASALRKLTGDLSPVEDFGFERYFEEPHFFEFFVQFLRNGELWVKAIRKGKKDKTIRNNLEDPIIVQYVTMLINGILSEMELRGTASNPMGPQRDLIIDNTMNLIAHFLDHNV